MESQRMGAWLLATNGLFLSCLGVDVEECLADDRLRESAGGYSFDCTWWRASHQTCYGRRYVSGCCACKAARRCYGQGQLTSLKTGAGATVWCETMNVVITYVPLSTIIPL